MKKQRKPLGLLVKFSILAVAAYAVYSVVSIQTQVSEKREEVNRLWEEREIRTQRVARLTDELNAPLDENAIARLARERLGLVSPRERVFFDISRSQGP